MNRQNAQSVSGNVFPKFLQFVHENVSDSFFLRFRLRFQYVSVVPAFSLRFFYVFGFPGNVFKTFFAFAFFRGVFKTFFAFSKRVLRFQGVPSNSSGPFENAIYVSNNVSRNVTKNWLENAQDVFKTLRTFSMEF